MNPQNNKAKGGSVRKTHDIPVIYVPQVFSSSEVANDIENVAPSKALGPDRISMLMFKHFDVSGVEFVSNVLNISSNTLIIPNVWKTVRLVLI